MTAAFAYAQLGRSVRFGGGVLDAIGEVVDDLGCSRALTFTTPSQAGAASRIAAILGPRSVGCSDVRAARVPAAVASAATETARETDADVLVALGGGSVVGVAKAVAAGTGLPVVAVPTTYSGSEMTAVYGVTENGRKQARHDVRVAPRAVLYDPDLTASLPADLTAGSGTNALAQAVGSLYATDRGPVPALLAGEGIRRMVAALPRCVASPVHRGPREDALVAAHLCGAALGMTGLSPHHELVHALGDRTRLPHAAVHAVLLPQTTAWALAHHPEVGSALRAVLATDDPAGALYDLLGDLGTPRGLVALGLDRDGFEAARVDLRRDPPGRWRDTDPGDLDEVLNRAHHGVRPPAGRAS